MSAKSNDNPPILDGKPLTDEQKRLSTLFDEMKKDQLTFLDEAGKRIIEMSTGLLGVLFAVIAFGKDFPPPYLKGNPLAQGLGIGVLVTLILALLAGVLTIQPRRYESYESNLTKMREELGKIVAYKSTWMRAATWCFFAGALLLAILIGSLVLLA
jgi:hypothetical protein